MYIKA